MSPFASNNFLEFQEISKLLKGPFAVHWFDRIPGNWYWQFTYFTEFQEIVIGKRAYSSISPLAVH